MVLRRSQIPALGAARLAAAIERLRALNISEAAKRLLEAMLRAAANPDAESPVVIIASLSGARRESIEEALRVLAAHASGIVARGGSSTREISDEEWRWLAGALLADLRELLSLSEEDADRRGLLGLALLLTGLGLGALLPRPERGEGAGEGVPALPHLVGVLYEMQPEEVSALAVHLLAQRERAWQIALAEKARQYGCERTPRAPRDGDLRELARMSREDAENIAATWNRDAARQLQKLHAADPNQTPDTYARQMALWAQQRATWKLPQIALQTEQTARAYAQERFRQENEVHDVPYVFTGPPPVCAECVGHFAAGVVRLSYVREHPAPVHIGCPHEWRELPDRALSCAEMWLG